METVYVLVPLAVLLAGLIVWVFFWAIKSGQFDDLEGPAHSILMDDDEPQRPKAASAHDRRDEADPKAR